MNIFARFLNAILGRKPKLDHDEFPREYALMCQQARSQAVGWYCKRYGVMPKVPFVRVTIEPKPRGGMGGWTNSAWDVHIWQNQVPFFGSLEHEMRHTLCLANGKGGSEEAAQ